MLASQPYLSKLALSKGLLVALSLAFPLGIAAGLLFYVGNKAAAPVAQELAPEMVGIPAHPAHYRPAGSFIRDGVEADPPVLSFVSSKPLLIMRHQVSAAEYGRCAAAGRCEAAGGAVGANLSAVKVSWEDALAYASWLSQKTGRTYRLPTDDEWIQAAGSRIPNNAVVAGSEKNPAKRWLAEYETEASRAAEERDLKLMGSASVNEYGVAGLAGAVWEWTDSCLIRTTLSSDGQSTYPATVNCGVRVVEGRHRTYLPNFVRDAKGGACSAGKPPSNLGFRLVESGGP